MKISNAGLKIRFLNAYVLLVRLSFCSSRTSQNSNPDSLADLNSAILKNVSSNLNLGEEQNSIHTNNAKIQEILDEYLRARSSFFQKVTEEVKPANARKNFDSKVKNLHKKIAQLDLKSFMDEEGFLYELNLYMQTDVTSNINDKTFEQIDVELDHCTSMYCHIGGLLTRELGSSYIKLTNNICKCNICYFARKGITSEDIISADQVNEMCVELKKLILKNIFFLNRFLILLKATPKLNKKAVDTIYAKMTPALKSFVTIFVKLDKLSAKTLQLPETFKSIFADAKSSLNSTVNALCHYLFLIKFSYDSKSNQKAQIVFKNELMPIKPLLLGISDDKLEQDFPNIQENFDYYKNLSVNDLNDNLDYAILECRMLARLRKLYPTQDAELADLYDESRGLKSMIGQLTYFINKFKVFDITVPIGEEETEIKNLYSEFEDVIDQLIYELDTVTKEQLEKALEDLLKEYLRGLFKELPKKDQCRFNLLECYAPLSQLTKDLLKELFLEHSDQVSKQVLRELEKKFASLRPANNILRDYFNKNQSLDTFKEILGNTYKDLPLLLSPFLNAFSNLKKKMDALTRELNTENLSYSVKEERVEKMKIEINEYLQGRAEKESEFFTLVAKAKSLLAEIFKFSPKKDEISQIKIQSPYEPEINWCNNLLSELKTLCNDAKKAEARKMKHIARLEAKQQAEQDIDAATAEQNTEAGPSNPSTSSSAENKRKSRNECHSSTKSFITPKSNNKRPNKFANLNKQKKKKE